MKVLEPKNLRYEQNIKRRECPKLTANAKSLDHWPHVSLILDMNISSFQFRCEKPQKQNVFVTKAH